ncbi:hypothetical protein BJ741DRAFT_614585 [Chytriomyces cf. hyalinus JEL632]|nr:hypothetical protein BJ741DRAFT_614585 [Chytriomyces cf. hyalinus JEL632]
MRLLTFATATSWMLVANAEAPVPSFHRRAETSNDTNITLDGPPGGTNITGANATNTAVTSTAVNAVAPSPKNETIPSKSSSSASSTPSKPAGAGDYEVPKTSKNSYITVINPLKGTAHNCGEALKITWSSTNAGNDKFDDETVSFDLVEASNYKDVKLVQGGDFPGEVAIKNLKAEVTLPKVAAGKSYAIKVSYKDTTRFIDWYSTVFEIRCSEVPATSKNTASSSSAAAAVATTAVASEDKPPTDVAKSASRSVAAFTFVSLVVAFLL